MQTILFFIIFFVVTVGLAQSPPKDLFQKSDLIEFTLACNLKELIIDIDDSRARYHSASLSYLDEDQEPITLKIQVKTRGHFRKSKENCVLPPLRFKFNTQSSQLTIFKDQSKLKLVTNCRMNNKKFEQFIIKEYLVYKAYNMLTPFSFNVRLVKINFVDTEGRYESFSTLSFFIEDNDDLALRNDAKILSTQGIHQEAVNQRMMNEMAIFQYMVGNTDWSVPKLHNIELVLINESMPIIAIPYDFDFCGIVNPPYTKPPEILPINHVTERYYRGYCKSLTELEPIFNKFISLKTDIQLLYKNDTLLESKEKKRILKYLDEFFLTIESPKLREREFFDNCRKD